MLKETYVVHIVHMQFQFLFNSAWRWEASIQWH